MSVDSTSRNLPVVALVHAGSERNAGWACEVSPRNFAKPSDSRHDICHEARHARGLDDFSADDLFLDAVDGIVREALAAIGDDPYANPTVSTHFPRLAMPALKLG
jgi:hypothetical protein